MGWGDFDHVLSVGTIRLKAYLRRLTSASERGYQSQVKYLTKWAGRAWHARATLKTQYREGIRTIGALAKRGCAIPWRRPSWVRIPPPAPFYWFIARDVIRERGASHRTNLSLIALRMTARLSPMSPTPTARARVTRPGRARRANMALTSIEAVMFCLTTRNVFRLRSST